MRSSRPAEEENRTSEEEQMDLHIQGISGLGAFRGHLRHSHRNFQFDFVCSDFKPSYQLDNPAHYVAGIRLLLMISNNKSEGGMTDSSDYIHHVNPFPNHLRPKIQRHIQHTRRPSVVPLSHCHHVLF
ncbi:hypothetical protein CEXT_638101 [Caerostris extrusa]|uniref:Uncharacterized protein n=1 Tax=Caerostris extrusa TaxID=172846 RepID=A0AAV4WPM5_CAEEX|nr:hypothetical protein CEXT_638101 [Caerostris extrusa]